MDYILQKAQKYFFKIPKLRNGKGDPGNGAILTIISISILLFGINKIAGYFNIFSLPNVNLLFLLTITFIIIFPYLIGKSYKINYSILKYDLTKIEAMLLISILLITLSHKNLFFAIFVLMLIIIKRYSKK